jgi:hypothetical protein
VSHIIEKILARKFIFGVPNEFKNALIKIAAENISAKFMLGSSNDNQEEVFSRRQPIYFLPIEVLVDAFNETNFFCCLNQGGGFTEAIRGNTKGVCV